jgi:hypothetical protein
MRWPFAPENKKSLPTTPKRHPEKKAAPFKHRKPRLVNVNFDPMSEPQKFSSRPENWTLVRGVRPKIGEMKRIVVRERPESEVPEKPDQEVNLNGILERLARSIKQLFRGRLSGNAPLVRIGLEIPAEMPRKEQPTRPLRTATSSPARPSAAVSSTASL